MLFRLKKNTLQVLILQKLLYFCFLIEPKN